MGSADLSQFIHKIKFAKQHSYPEKTYFKYALDVPFNFCSVYKVNSFIYERYFNEMSFVSINGREVC